MPYEVKNGLLELFAFLKFLHVDLPIARHALTGRLRNEVGLLGTTCEVHRGTKIIVSVVCWHVDVVHALTLENAARSVEAIHPADTIVACAIQLEVLLLAVDTGILHTCVAVHVSMVPARALQAKTARVSILGKSFAFNSLVFVKCQKC